jgi:ankyrin repeat protein
MVRIAGPGTYGNDFMVQAAAHGKRRMLVYFLRRGYDVNYENTGGTTPLSAAAVGGDKEMVRFLISSGADVNRKNRLTGGSPLMAASEMGQLETAKALLEKGADPCATNKDGNTAAGLATRYSHSDIAE